MKAGYTLIELMIVITITAVLVMFGISSYTKAQKSQTVKAAAETILAALSESQKLASTGNKDCNGPYVGQQVTFVGSSNLINSQSICEGGVVGLEKSVSVDGIIFTASHVLTFMPINQGIRLQSGTLENIDFTAGQSTYQIEVTSSGSIRNKGKQ